MKIEYKDQTVEVQYESTTVLNARQKAEVSVTKKDSETTNPLDGGQYTLYTGRYAFSLCKGGRSHIIMKLI